MDKFVNLHGHSRFSLLDGMTPVNALVDYTLKLGQPASCITDHGVMYSIVDHFQYANSVNEAKGKAYQKAIAGFEAYLVKDHLIKNKEEAQSETENKREHMVLLAMNNDGYKRITKMCSTGCTEGFYYRPRIDDKVIESIGTDGVIGMSACLAGRIAQNIMKDRIEEAEKWAVYYYKLFKGNFYLELQPTIEPEQVKVNMGLIEIHKKTGIPVVATTDFHYLQHEDAEVHDVLLAVQSRSLLSDPKRWRFPGDTFYVMSRQEILDSFKRNGHEVLDQKVIEQAVDMTVEIADKCNVTFEWEKHYLPKITPDSSNEEFNSWANKRTSDGSVSADYLRYLCIKGLKQKNKTSKEYRDRLEYELGVINTMGFPDYFLIMEDIMRFCRENDIPVGPARGSGGGSLVAYACGITKLDPLIYDLLFERFLNPERKKLPDIDSDFCVKKGYMVFEYLIKKYGKEYCCNIATFGRLQLKLVIKDIAKAMGIEFEEVNDFTRHIGDDIEHVADLRGNAEYAEFVKKYPKLFDYAEKLEGSPRHVSQHPAGICVTPVPVTDLIPVQNAKETQEGAEVGYLSQFEKEQSEQSGVVKLDILKLKNVTEIDEQLKEINRRYGLKMTEEDIPLDDAKTWAMFAKGDTLGVFQFASNVAIPVIKKIKPTNIEELAAANSFIRPGTSGLDEYVAAKMDATKLRKLDPRLDRHLAKTYGAIVFQEQIMFLIAELLGISFGEADLYRRALEKPAKDKKGYVKFFNENVVRIASEKGFDPQVAETVRQLIIDNSGYAFNKSHAVAYSLISYWTAWIKTNYPLIFYTTMFNGNLDALSTFMEEAKKNGISINPPHASYSKYDSTIEDEVRNIIRVGLNAVKGLGPKAVESIVANQPFVSIDDFFERNESRSVNKKVVEACIGIGAFEGLGIQIEPSDIPEDIRTTLFNTTIVNNKMHLLLNRNQLWYWYEKVNEFASIKSIPNYAVPKTMIKGKFLDIYELAFEKDDAGEEVIIIPEDKLNDFDLKLENVAGYRTRKKPKGFLKLVRTDEIKVPPFRKPIVVYYHDLSQIKENYLETYLKETEDLGFSFLSHPLEKHVDKLMLYSDVEDGYMMITAGIIKGFIERKTQTGKKYYWMFLQTPRDTVRVTLWDNQYKQYVSILKKHNLIKIKGIKGYGGIGCEGMAEIKIQ